MFLRSLSLRGFKSFAQKTTLEFTPGISVIVGPNGSGKSNLVDAISWVLGEQGLRALRGGQMADVIFAGSAARPGLGLAEVKLVIDNSAGLVPVPLSEIEISRAVFRSGDSEYRIGGQPVRLLDIQELLAETGIGRALHTVVGQGQLEDVLTARPAGRAGGGPGTAGTGPGGDRGRAGRSGQGPPGGRRVSFAGRARTASGGRSRRRGPVPAGTVGRAHGAAGRARRGAGPGRGRT